MSRPTRILCASLLLALAALALLARGSVEPPQIVAADEADGIESADGVWLVAPAGVACERSARRVDVTPPEAPAFLVADVTDAAGRSAAGVPLWLAIEREDGEVALVAEATVDPNGRARFAAADARLVGGRDLYLFAFDPGAMRPRRITPMECASGQAQVRLPERGRLVLELHEEDGTAHRPELASGSKVIVDWRDASGFEGSFRAPVSVHGSRLVIHDLPVGAQLEVDVVTKLHAEPWRGAGPAGHGGSVIGRWCVEWSEPGRTDTRRGCRFPEIALPDRDPASSGCIVRGRVADDRGAPVARVRIVVYASNGWCGTAWTGCVTGQDGAFEFETSVTLAQQGFDAKVDLIGHAHPRIRIEAERIPDQLPLVFDVGTIRLHASCVALGSIVVDPWIDSDLWFLDWGRQQASSGTPRVQRSSPGASQFLVHAPDGEPIDLYVHLRHDPVAVAVVRGIPMLAGGSTLDPRCRPIRLDGKIRRASFPVQDAFGDPIWRAVLVALDHSAGGETPLEGNQVITHFGRFSFLTGRPTVDVRVSADGFEPRVFRGLRGGETLLLHRAQ